MWTVIVLLLVAMAVVGLVASFTRSSGRQQREEGYEQRFGPLS
jgi:hypothetical protein